MINALTSTLSARLLPLAGLLLALAFLAGPSAQAEDFPSTNDANRANGWAHVDVVSTAEGQITLAFISTRDVLSCFEHRTDLSSTVGTTCVNNTTESQTFQASAYVEVRLGFSLDPAEQFDWTRFYLVAEEPPVPEPEDPGPSDPALKDDCKDGGWEAFGFRNQGLCIQFVNTARDSR